MNRELNEVDRQIANIAEDCKGWLQRAMDEMDKLAAEAQPGM